MTDSKTTKAPEKEPESPEEVSNEAIPTDEEVAAVAAQYRGKKADFPRVRSGMPPGPEL